MRVAYLGLAYHRRTRSTRFLLDLLERHATVDAFFAEPDFGAVRRACADFREDAYDAIVVLQLHEAFALLSGRHPNVTFAPMYDAMWRGGAFTWKSAFAAAKILCFSWALRAEVMRRAPVHAHVQYYPDPALHPAVSDFDALRGFLWYRRRDIPPETAFAMTAGTRFESLAIHDAPDPGHEAPFPAAVPPHLGRLQRTVWSEDGRGFADALAAANVFFAPRPLEGIGMSFLEAMARGLCVVAPDAPTMNEYISHGTNGLLYVPGRNAPLDFSRARDIAARAREDVVRGRARWEGGLPALMEFIATPTARLATRRNVAASSAVPGAIRALPAGAVSVPNEAGWIVLASPGTVHDGAALERAVATARPGAEAIRGHWLRRDRQGVETLQRAEHIGASWTRMMAGDLHAERPSGFGAPEATLISPALLRRLQAPPPQTSQMLCDLLLRAEEAGALLEQVDDVLATVDAVDSTVDADRWVTLVEGRAGAEAATALRAAFAAAANASRRRVRAAAPARAAVRLVDLFERISPMLGRAAEALLFGGPLRRLRGVLRR